MEPVEVVEDSQVQESVVEPEPVKMVPKQITCPRCGGTGTWVSSRTGVRMQAASGPLTDITRDCPKCKGRKTVLIRITEEQANAEKEAKRRAKVKIDAERKKAKARIDEEARAKKAAL